MNSRLQLTVWATLVAVCLGTTGCYTTVIDTRATALPEEHFDRQWFLFAGLLPVSSPAGDECKQGVAIAKSKYGVGDFFINLGITAAASIGYAATCNEVNGACLTTASSIGSLASWIVNTRSVTYQCRAPSMGSSAPAPVAEPAPESAQEQEKVEEVSPVVKPAATKKRK